MKSFIPTKQLDYRYKQPWYSCEESADAANTLDMYISSLKDSRSYIYRRFRKAIELYENVECPNLLSWQFMTNTDIDGPYQYNIIESIVDTIHANIITARTRPVFFTEGGDWESQQKSRDLTDFIGGLFHQNKVQESLSQRVCLDALVFGTGFLKVYEKNGKLKAERVFPYDIVMDEVETALSSSTPRNLYQSRYVPRETVYAWYADDEERLRDLRTSPSSDLTSWSNASVGVDIFHVVEAWHLPSGNDNGRHMITCGTVVLLDEEWPNEWFPFVFLKYKERTKGWWGKGIPEILEGQQELINDLRDKMNAQVKGSAPFIWVKPGAKLTESEISNRIWRVIETEDPPQYVASNSIPPDLMARYQQEVAESAQLVGVNALMLKSELPPGVQSGKAIRLLNDTGSQRLMAFSRAYQGFHIELAELFLRYSDMLLESGIDLDVMHDAGSYVKRMTYSDIRIDLDCFVIKPEATNFLSDTPSGRLSDVEALASIFPEEMKPQLVRLLDNPDIKSISGYLSADEDSISNACSSILRGEKTAGQVAPNPYLDLSLCIRISRRLLLDAQTQGAPIDRLLELENWMAMVKSLSDQLTSPTVPQQVQGEPKQ